MPGLTTQPVVPIEEWLTESVRTTVFPASGVVLAPDTWWRGVLGGDPETRTVKPALREHRDEGAFGDGKLVLSVNPLGVVQWQLGAPDVTVLPEGLPAAGPFVRRTAEFLDLMDRWIPMCPASNRVAYGAVALLPVGGHREGYERLGSLLRTVKVDSISTAMGSSVYRTSRLSFSVMLLIQTVRRTTLREFARRMDESWD